MARSTAAALCAAAVVVLICRPAARAADLLRAELAGKTVSAVVYLSSTPGPVSGRSLKRIMLQAYLAPGGTALFREWTAARDSYTAPQPARWSIAGEKFCLDLPAPGFCADVHVWGPRIAGVGIRPYAMLDGDLQPGNAIAGSRRRLDRPTPGG